MSESPHTEKVLKLWTKYVKALPGLNSARLSGDIKSAMQDVADTSDGDSAKIKAVIGPYLTARGRSPETGAKIEGAPITAKPKVKPPKQGRNAPDPDQATGKGAPIANRSSSDPAKDALIAAGAKKALKGDDEAGVPKGNIDLRKLNRQTLKGMAKDLEAGYKKRWTDEELRVKVAAKMVGMDAAAASAIAKADPAKLTGLEDCVGVLLDLSQAICITCPAQQDCRKLFEQHRQNGFKIFDSLKVGDTVAFGSNNGSQIDAKVSGPKIVREESKIQSTKLEHLHVGKIAKLPKVQVDGKEIPDNLAYKEFLIAVKKTEPGSLEAFQRIVADHYETEDLPALTQWLMKYCIALKMFKLA